MFVRRISAYAMAATAAASGSSKQISLTLNWVLNKWPSIFFVCVFALQRSFLQVFRKNHKWISVYGRHSHLARASFPLSSSVKTATPVSTSTNRDIFETVFCFYVQSTHTRPYNHVTCHHQECNQSYVLFWLKVKFSVWKKKIAPKIKSRL